MWISDDVDPAPSPGSGRTTRSRGARTPPLERARATGSSSARPPAAPSSTASAARPPRGRSRNSRPRLALRRGRASQASAIVPIAPLRRHVTFSIADPSTPRVLCPRSRAGAGAPMNLVLAEHGVALDGPLAPRPGARGRRAVPRDLRCTSGRRSCRPTRTTRSSSSRLTLGDGLELHRVGALVPREDATFDRRRGGAPRDGSPLSRYQVDVERSPPRRHPALGPARRRSRGGAVRRSLHYRGRRPGTSSWRAPSTTSARCRSSSTPARRSTWSSRGPAMHARHPHHRERRGDGARGRRPVRLRRPR